VIRTVKLRAEKNNLRVETDRLVAVFEAGRLVELTDRSADR